MPDFFRGAASPLERAHPKLGFGCAALKPPFADILETAVSAG